MRYEEHSKQLNFVDDAEVLVETPHVAATTPNSALRAGHLQQNRIDSSAIHPISILQATTHTDVDNIEMASS